MDLQADSLAFYILEFCEGLFGDIDSVLEGMGGEESVKKVLLRDTRSGTYIVGLAGGDVHHS